MITQAAPRLRLVAPPDPYRTRGGQVPDKDAPGPWPYAPLPVAVYRVLVTGWSIGPVWRTERPLRPKATEREYDWRVFMVGKVIGAAANQVGAAASAVLRYRQEHDGRAPLLCTTFRLAVGVQTGFRRIPEGPTSKLAALWELLGHRKEGWSPEIADKVIGWRFAVLTRQQTTGRGKAVLPKALHRTWGDAIHEADPPCRPR